MVLLRHFRTLAQDYFQNIQYPDWMGSGSQPRMNEKAQLARAEINRILEDVDLSFALVGVVRVIVYTPPPMIGGYVQKINIIDNIFSLYLFQISPDSVFDSTDRAIGVYERECARLRRKIFNPFYWVGLLIVWLMHLPFMLLGAAGFDSHKVEESLFGRLFKVIGAIIIVVTFAILLADHWTMVLNFLHRVVAALRHL